MDLLYIALPLAIFLYSLLHFLKPKPRLPPGPRGLPIIGSLHRLASGLPHRKLRDLAAVHGPLMRLEVGQIPLVVVSSPDTAREFLKTYDINFASRPEFLAGKIVGYDWADILFAPYGDYWRKLRKLCAMEILSPKRVHSFRHIREEEVLDFLHTIRAAGSSPVNLSVMFHALTNSIVGRVALGGKCRDATAFLSATKQVVGLSSGFNLPDLFPSLASVLSTATGMKRKLEDIHGTIDKIFEEIIEERKERRAAKLADGSGEAAEENLLDVLLGLQEKGGLDFDFTQNTVKAVILDMFAGGTGTSASAMEWTMSELVKNPRVMKKLQAQIREVFRGKPVITETDFINHGQELNYLKLAIKESLRLHPPAPLLVPRECTETCEIEGYVIPRKTRVVVNAWAIGRDPKYWDDAEEFKPERFEGGGVDFHGTSYEFLPFGSGRRMCPGYNYGLASMELAFVQLLYCFDWSLPRGVEEVDMAEAPGLGVRRKSPLCLCATPVIAFPSPMKCA